MIRNTHSYTPQVECDPPPLYAWDADHKAGVTSDRGAAIGHVYRALADAPAGTAGVVRRVMVGTSGRVEYVDLGTVGTARRDDASGVVVWTDGTAAPAPGVTIAVIPDFTTTQLPEGTWRARHVVDHELVVERVSLLALEAACCAARVARGSRAVSVQE